MRRCSFSTLDVFPFLERCEDSNGHGIYADPPFIGAGLRYKHNPGKGEEFDWHKKLSESLSRFDSTRVVCRFYDHDCIRHFYRDSAWHWVRLAGGKKQSNDAAPEVLVIRNPEPDRLFQ